MNHLIIYCPHMSHLRFAAQIIRNISGQNLQPFRFIQWQRFNSNNKNITQQFIHIYNLYKIIKKILKLKKIEWKNPIIFKVELVFGVNPLKADRKLLWYVIWLLVCCPHSPDREGGLQEEKVLCCWLSDVFLRPEQDSSLERQRVTQLHLPAAQTTRNSQLSSLQLQFIEGRKTDKYYKTKNSRLRQK